MKLKLKEVGLLKNVKLEIKGLTIIVGENNTGKSLLLQRIKKELEQRLENVQHLVGGFKAFMSQDLYLMRKMTGDHFKRSCYDDEFILESSKYGSPVEGEDSSLNRLAEIYLCLKRYGNPPKPIVLDNPESCLSPANQVLMGLNPF